MSTPKVICMHCEEPWFSLIRQGIKPVEGRKNSPKYQGIEIGNIIEFSNGRDTFKAKVVDIKKYLNLEAYLSDVTFQKALPGTHSLKEAMQIYYQWSTPEEIQKNGFLGIFIQPISE